MFVRILARVVNTEVKYLPYNSKIEGSNRTAERENFEKVSVRI